MPLNLQKQRFPRTKDKEILYLAKIRTRYKPPPYNPRRDGGWNPADGIFDWLLKCSEKKLRRLCRKHALKDIGPRKKLIKRMYLHWRAKKLGIGKIWLGYGKGYEFTRQPTCPCGSVSRKSIELETKRKEQLKEQQRRMKKYIMQPTIRRYPRYEKGRIHFPRL